MEKNKKTTTLLLVLGLVFFATGVVMLSATWGLINNYAWGPLGIGLFFSIIAGIRWWKEN
mgnify:CR=1 FL=1